MKKITFIQAGLVEPFFRGYVLQQRKKIPVAVGISKKRRWAKVDNARIVDVKYTVFIFSKN
jgi:hypothetical protein